MIDQGVKKNNKHKSVANSYRWCSGSVASSISPPQNSLLRSMPMKRLIVVRHGETDYNKKLVVFVVVVVVF